MVKNIGRDLSASTCRHRIRVDAFIPTNSRHDVFWERVHATVIPFLPSRDIYGEKWQRIINLLPKHIEINKFGINHLIFSKRWCYWPENVLQNACDDGECVAREGANQQHQHHINRFSSACRCWIRRRRRWQTAARSSGRNDLDACRWQLKDTNKWMNLRVTGGLHDTSDSTKLLKAITSLLHSHKHKPHGPYNVAINRKMDDHNRKRKDVIYFYYRQTAFDGFAE